MIDKLSAYHSCLCRDRSHKNTCGQTGLKHGVTSHWCSFWILMNPWCGVCDTIASACPSAVALTSIPDIIWPAVPSSYQNYTNLEMQVELINAFRLQRLSNLNTCANAFPCWLSHEVLSMHRKTGGAWPWTAADTHNNSSSDSSPSSPSPFLPFHAVAVWHGMKLLAI